MDRPNENRVFLFKIIVLQGFFVLLFYFNLVPNNFLNNLVSKETSNVSNVKAENTQIGLPVRLIIPKINVDTMVVGVGVNLNGEMEAPKTASHVGWFEMGPRPAELGSAVIAGHFDDKNGGAGVFSDLGQLVEGDVIIIEDELGVSRTFVVNSSKVYDPGYADDVFGQSEGKHLNLITCDGVWEGTKKSYSKRLVVFADIMN